VKKYLMADAPVRIEAPAGVSLFTYDNGAYVIESFRDTATAVKVVKNGAADEVTIPPHSFRVFKN
jgi:hypothetical protein